MLEAVVPWKSKFRTARTRKLLPGRINSEGAIRRQPCFDMVKPWSGSRASEIARLIPVLSASDVVVKFRRLR
jgi:hypothetical protein